MELSGAPKTVLTVTDASVIKDTPISGIVCVQGETMRGEIAKPQFVGNSLQFKRKFGGEHPTSRFAEYCMRMLDAGIKLWVSPVSHFTSTADKTTAVGTKATGTITVSSNVIQVRAKHLGLGYTGTVVTIRAAESLAANKVDFLIKVPDSDQTEIIPDVPTTLTSDLITAFNNKSEHLNIVSVTGTVPVGSVTLAGAVHDASTVVAADYNGDPVGKTGWYSFGTVRDAFRIANIHKADPVIDAGMASYVVNVRKDMRFLWGAPATANAQGIEDYRNGTGSYSHAVINAWQGTFISGAVMVTASNGTQYPMPAIVDALPLYAKKDALFGANYSAAGATRGTITMPNNGVYFNLGSPDNQADFDRLYKFGVNAVIDDESFGVVYWGNASALRDRTKILSKDNVADLVMFILRELRPKVRKFQFDPNDISMFKAMYREVKPFITDELEAKRAIRPGEGKNWFWYGDQDVTDLSQATFNSQSDLSSGRYRARFLFIPIAANEYIAIDVMPTDAGSFELIVSNQ